MLKLPVLGTDDPPNSCFLRSGSPRTVILIPGSGASRPTLAGILRALGNTRCSWTPISRNCWLRAPAGMLDAFMAAGTSPRYPCTASPRDPGRERTLPRAGREAPPASRQRGRRARRRLLARSPAARYTELGLLEMQHTRSHNNLGLCTRMSINGGFSRTRYSTADFRDPVAVHVTVLHQATPHRGAASSRPPA